MSSMHNELVQPDRIVESAQRRIDDQIQVVEKLKAEGRSTLEAERLLEIYRAVLAALAD